jgi:hypothetical protein
MIRRVLGHPRHVESFEHVVQLVTRLHRVRTPSDFYTLHDELVHRIYEADEWRAQCANIELRIRGNSPCDPSWSAVDWELERIVADRIARQLRCVGDGLAWKAFGYSRQLVVALASNRGKPNLYDKAGFWCELTVLKQSWEDDGHFAVLHDATNCLTIADITVCSGLHAAWVDADNHKCNSERYVLNEVKNHKGRCVTLHRGEQLRRMQMAVDALVKDEPVVGRDGEARRLFKSTLQFKTRLRQVERLLEEAFRSGYAVGQIQRHWVASARAPAQAVLIGVDRAVLQAAEERAFSRAGFTGGRHRFMMSSADILGLAPDLAPFSIYPFRPEICAALICDYLVFVSALEITALTDALHRAGFKEGHEAAIIDLNQPDRAVAFGVVNGRAISVNGAALQQILLEFADLKRQAEAMKEYASRPDFLTAIGILTLKNERGTWR